MICTVSSPARCLVATLVAGTLGLAPALAAAQTASTNRVDARQDKQETRIEKGKESGELNKKEAARLEKGQERVQKMEDRAMKDGKVTKAEAKKIENVQDVQSGRIATQKNDKQEKKQ